MPKVVLEYVKNEDRTSSTGNPYTSCSIKIRGKYYNGFGDEVTRTWKPGQTVNVDLWEEEYQGKMKGKFTRMEPDELEGKINNILERLSHIEAMLKKYLMTKVPQGPVEPPVKDPVSDEDLKKAFPGSEITEEKKDQKSKGEPW